MTSSLSRIATLIVDDEPLARRGIRQLLLPHPTFEVVGESRDGRDAVQAIRTLAPALVFLDVQMPVMSGFDVVRAVGVEAMPLVAVSRRRKELVAEMLRRGR